MNTRLTDCRATNWQELSLAFAECFPKIPETERSYQLRNYKDGTRLLWMESELAGFTIHVDGKGEKLAWLEMIGVRAKFRGNHFGQLLLRDFEEVSARHGYQRVELAVAKTNLSAIRMYETSGYAKVDREGASYTYFKNLFPGSSLNSPIFRNRSLESRLRRVFYRALYSILVR